MKYLCISVFILECISVRGGMSIECIFNEVYVLHFWMAFLPLSERFHYYCSQLLVSLFVKINVRNPKERVVG